MIYCNLKGGLGNMMFQIAAVKSIAIDNDTDCSFPNLESHLNYLNNETTYNPKLNHSSEYRGIFKNLNTTPIKCSKRLTYPFEYVDIKLPKSDIILDGFFQSEKYFIHNRDSILEYIKPPQEVFDFIEEKYGHHLKNKTTSIHVRRGDYVNHQSYHPTQSLEYYNNSINKVKENTDLFLIFSDDINWCKENLKIDNSIYIEGEKDYIELYLMSLCNNNIIANSSFSWWGAWLNNNTDKTVIGPKKWFGPSINHDTSDILPESWIKL